MESLLHYCTGCVRVANFGFQRNSVDYSQGQKLEYTKISIPVPNTAVCIWCSINKPNLYIVNIIKFTLYLGATHTPARSLPNVPSKLFIKYIPKGV